MKIGVLLSNLGTPSAPTPDAVKKYLAEFLSDRAVVNLPRLLWWPILYGIILRTRPQKSAELYRKIWLDEGSPLLVNSQRLSENLADTLANENIPVALGMRYGEPSLNSASKSLWQQGVKELIVLPLYPQYSLSTSGSTFIAVEKALENFPMRLRNISSYASHPDYIAAIAQQIRSHWQTKPRGQKLVFSFHGIPDIQSRRGDPYEKECRQTAQLVATELQLRESEWDLVFQSRFGYAKWLQPYCVEALQNYGKQNIKNIDIICPGFASDCLETLEEINMTNREIFEAHGGKEYHYIPALNSDPAHVSLLATLVREKTI